MLRRRGAIAVLARDDARGALLLEEARPGTRVRTLVSGNTEGGAVQPGRTSQKKETPTRAASPSPTRPATTQATATATPTGGATTTTSTPEPTRTTEGAGEADEDEANGTGG